MLDDAHAVLVEGAKRLNLTVQVVRKPRSVGIVPQAPTIYEVQPQTLDPGFMLQECVWILWIHV